MPAYSKIQTAIPYRSDSFRAVLKKMEQFCIELGFDEKVMAEWIAGIEWDVCNNGFVYSGGHQGAQQISFSDEIFLNVRPIVMGMSSMYYRNLPYDILIIELLFEMDQICDWMQQRYRPWMRKVVEETSERMSRYFFEYGIFFTNEVTDMMPLESLICGDSKYLWYYDFALVPITYEAAYSELPKNYVATKGSGAIRIIRNNSWIEE